MAIEIGPIAKPTIWLVGRDISTNDMGNFSGRVDHAKHIEPLNSLTIGGFTEFRQDKILTFDQRVRIIITTIVTPRATYFRESGSFSGLEFEGSPSIGRNKSTMNQEAETYYTLNGKDPIRTKANLYNYLDLNDAKTTTNPSSGAPDNDYDYLNLPSLGFLFSASPTGSDFITIKAKTYQLGNESRISIARFKIARPKGSLVFENIETGI